MSDSTQNAKWREDFPIEWGVDNYITRREFTKFMVLASGATFAGNGYFVIRKYQDDQVQHPQQRVCAESEVAPGDVKQFRYPTENDPAILLRLGDENGAPRYAAYLQRCTHLTCPVHFSQHTKRLECPCHNGSFDAATGAVISGPPPRPLPRIALKIEGGEIFAVGFDQSDKAHDERGVA
jgi:Rieske Fe-S protein